MAVDTLLLCFCEDTRINDGSEEKPYFMDKSLMVSMGVIMLWGYLAVRWMQMCQSIISLRNKWHSHVHNVMQHNEKGDFAAEMFSRNRWKQASKNKDINKNIQQYFMYNTWLCRSISMNKVSYWSLENAPREWILNWKLSLYAKFPLLMCYIMQIYRSLCNT